MREKEENETRTQSKICRPNETGAVSVGRHETFLEGRKNDKSLCWRILLYGVLATG